MDLWHPRNPRMPNSHQVLRSCLRGVRDKMQRLRETIKAMTPEELIRLMEAAATHRYTVRVSPDGTVEMRPGKGTSAERTAAWRLRRSVPPPEPPPLEEQVPKPKRTTYGPEPEACTISPPESVGPQVLAAWQEWQTYRQTRASHPTSRLRIPWTAQAARLSANSVQACTASHGPQIVADRITAAIAGNWQGLNFDKLETHANHRPANRAPSRNPVGTKKANPALDGDFLPGDF